MTAPAPATGQPRPPSRPEDATALRETAYDEMRALVAERRAQRAAAARRRKHRRLAFGALAGLGAALYAYVGHSENILIAVDSFFRNF